MTKQRVPVVSTDRFYLTCRRLAQLLSAAENELSLRLGAGDVIAFDNRRIVPARDGFDQEAC